jgi:hypothetical protein
MTLVAGGSPVDRHPTGVPGPASEEHSRLLAPPRYVAATVSEIAVRAVRRPAARRAWSHEASALNHQSEPNKAQLSGPISLRSPQFTRSLPSSGSALWRKGRVGGIALRSSVPAGGQDATTCRGEGSHRRASAIILRNEVLAARADPEAATLAIVQGTVLDRSRAKATGGVLRIINPWKQDDSALKPIAYRNEVPMR